MAKANITFTHKMDSPRPFKVYVEAEGHIVHEIYGSDADGNRGVPISSVDNLEISIIDARQNDLTKKIKEKYPIEWQDITESALRRLWDISAQEENDRFYF